MNTFETKPLNTFNDPFFTIINQKQTYMSLKRRDERIMMVWKYTIQSDAGVIITQNADYAEKKSKLGNIIFCKRENNVYKFNH